MWRVRWILTNAWGTYASTRPVLVAFDQYLTIMFSLFDLPRTLPWILTNAWGTYASV